MIYDLGFIFNQFIEPLPKTYAEWQRQVRDFMPSIFDTKVLSCQVGTFGKTELSHLFNKC